MNTALPFDLATITELDKTYSTPFYIYDEQHIQKNAENLVLAMQSAGLDNFKNYYAVKALPNPAILKILKDSGMGADCSSLAELKIAQSVGLSGEQIMFTSNNTAEEEFAEAQKLKAIINFDDLSMVEPFVAKFGLPHVACCRYNPGNISFGGVNEAIIGTPSEAKYGMPLEQIIKAYKILKKAGVKKFGLHTMLLSNELDWRHHERIAEALFQTALTIANEVGITFSFINLGGGIGVPYRPEERSFDLSSFAQALKNMYTKYNLASIGSPRIVMENGRYITANTGYLVTKVINIKRTHKVYVGVDATMANLMRPGMYGAYHHITILGKETEPAAEVIDIVGSLCENNDKFAIDRNLPKIEVGDILVIHTAGAHAHAMGFQYNGKLRSAELLLRSDKSVQLIRRAETLDDYFGTLQLEEKEKIK